MTAFFGRRDGYEVPAALAERGLLDGFVTDWFASSTSRRLASLLPKRTATKLASRDDERIPLDRVYRAPPIVAEGVLHRLRRTPPDTIYEQLDPQLGRRAAVIAREHRSDLFIYSPHADAAFSARYQHDPRRVLFQFHPHIATERCILQNDMVALRNMGADPRQLLEGSLDPGKARLAADDAWRKASHIVCASSFTKRSLMEAGADPARITVVPYGVELPVIAHRLRSECFHVLFVGTGLYRKGLHHLIDAWRVARLPLNARLTVVARSIEPALLDRIRETAGIGYRSGVDTATLAELYDTASLFAMPSLVEGFGQVFLEALAHGLPVLGTPNTCVPDLGTPAEGAFVVDVGNVDQLAATLEQLATTLPGNADWNARARGVAERFTWARFRSGIVNAALA